MRRECELHAQIGDHCVEPLVQRRERFCVLSELSALVRAVLPTRLLMALASGCVVQVLYGCTQCIYVHTLGMDTDSNNVPHTNGNWRQQ